jgi:hypothetical protein
VTHILPNKSRSAGILVVINDVRRFADDKRRRISCRFSERRQTVARGSTGPFGLAIELLLVFVFTTMLLMTYMARIQFDDYLRETALKLRGETLEKMRREKLARLNEPYSSIPSDRRITRTTCE